MFDAACTGSAPVADVVRLLASLLAHERFNEGLIAEAIDNGVLLAAARRVREALAEMRTSSA